MPIVVLKVAAEMAVVVSVYAPVVVGDEVVVRRMVVVVEVVQLQVGLSMMNVFEAQ